jgi:hypothetical protein
VATAPAPAAQSHETQPVQPVPPKGGGGALKIILIIVGILVLLGLIAGSVIAYIGYRASRAVRVDANGNTTVETPWGKVSTNNDTEKIARELGVPVYPGAKQLDGSGAVAFGDNLSFGNAEFETGDSLEKVQQFYKQQLPKAIITPVDENQCAIQAVTSKSMVTISLERADDKTIIRMVKAAANAPGAGAE